MKFLPLFAGFVLIAVILGDAFETILLPRRVTRRIRLARMFYRNTWIPWSALSRFIRSVKGRETYLSYYGPLSLIFLLSAWAFGLIVGFALLYYSFGPAVKGAVDPGFGTVLYLSGTTFFTLGFGDITPATSAGRVLAVMESGIGFAFLALVLSYIPALNQSFSRREVNISLLDARAGSPPTAAQILVRHSRDPGLENLRQLLHEWEGWSAELLEIHLSYPVLVFFRSQHDNQSWLGALTAVLDTCSIIMAGVEGACSRQAELTFAIARHAVVDLSIVLRSRPQEPEQDRFPLEGSAAMRLLLANAGLKLKEGEEAEQRLKELRHMYEPYVHALSRYLHIEVPPWISDEALDNWQISEWSLIADMRRRRKPDQHF